MQTRRDQVQAHAFVSGRLVSAMLRAEPDAPFSPLRRFAIGSICGLLIGGLVIAGFGIYGVVSPGGDKSWRKPGSLIVEKETGARYVYVDDQLRPVLNYTSARLLVNGEPTVARVSRNSLQGVPHGLPVGIPNAPDSLPDLGRLDGRNWQVCSALRPDGTGATRPFVTLWVGGKSNSRELAADEALIVRAPNGQLYLAWNNRRFLVPSLGILSALGYAASPPYPVGWGWVNAVPAAPDLAASDVPGRGQPGTPLDGRPAIVGQLFKANTIVPDVADTQYFVMRTDGLSPLSPIGAALLLADPKTKAAYPTGPVDAFTVSTAALATAPRSKQVSINPQHPVKPPRLAGFGANELPCVQLAMNTDGPTVGLGFRPVTIPGAVAAAVAGGDRLLADQVVVDPGAGLLVRHQPAPGVLDGALFLLVDTGVRFPLGGEDVAKALGYAGVRPVPVPAPLLGLIPVGPPLDPDAARATEPIARPGAGDVKVGGQPGGTYG